MATNDQEKPSEKNTLVKLKRRHSQLRYLSQSVMLEEAQNPHMVRITMLLVSAAILAFIAWASLAKVSEVAASRGEVVPSGHIQIVQHLEGGILAKIHVKEGQAVSEGELLLELDGAGTQQDLSRLKAKQLSLELQSERLKAFVNHLLPEFEKIIKKQRTVEDVDMMVTAQEKVFSSMANARRSAKKVARNQLAQKKGAQEIIKSRLDTIRENIKIAKEARDMMKDLAEEKVVSRMTYLERQESYNTLLGEQNELLSELSKARQSITEYENRLLSLEAKHRDEAYQELDEIETEMAQNQEAIKKLQDRADRLTIKSPVYGLVKGLRVNTIGGVIPSGQTLMEIVPLEHQLVVEARISPRDIGHVNIGQKVRVKVSSFDFSRYGVIDGTLEFVSATTFADENGGRYYRGRISLDKNYVGNDHTKNLILPGMIVQADIITGEKTILSYLLKPIHLAVSTAFTER